MTLSLFLAVFYCAHFGSRLPGGIRSSGPTTTGSCLRTRQSPPNPLARFRAVATVRCVKNRACSDRSGRAASVAPPLSRRLCRAASVAPPLSRRLCRAASVAP
ncbi:hypothetical protein ACEOKT_004817 [Salmonella enterica]